MGQIPDLSDDEWDALTERLTLYAQHKMSKLYWRGVPASRGGRAPGGIEPQDLAASAIVSVIDGTRHLDSTVHPDLRQFLEGVIDSMVNHLAGSAENRVTRREAVTTEGQNIEPYAARRNPARDPADICCEQDSAERFQALIEKEIAGEARLHELFDCFKADIAKPQEIAEVLDCEVTEINNIQKKLRRRVDKVIRRHAARSKT